MGTGTDVVWHADGSGGDGLGFGGDHEQKMKASVVSRRPSRSKKSTEVRSTLRPGCDNERSMQGVPATATVTTSGRSLPPIQTASQSHTTTRLPSNNVLWQLHLGQKRVAQSISDVTRAAIPYVGCSKDFRSPQAQTTQSKSFGSSFIFLHVVVSHRSCIRVAIDCEAL